MKQALPTGGMTPSNNITLFLDRYGIDTTTNFQLMRYAADLKIPNFHCIMRNELNSLRKRRKLPTAVICNYQTTDALGTHWIAMYKDHGRSFYFDSYGIGPFDEAKAFLGHGVYNTFQIQPQGTSMCGQLCLYVLYTLHRQRDFFNTILELNNHFNSI